MPVLPTSNEIEQEFIGRCMSEEKESFPDQAQRYAICKSKWDSSQNMAAIKASRSFRDEFMKHIPSNKSIK